MKKIEENFQKLRNCEKISSVCVCEQKQEESFSQFYKRKINIKANEEKIENLEQVIFILPSSFSINKLRKPRKTKKKIQNKRKI